MNVFELFDPAPTGYQDEKADNSTLKMSDSRKTRLTLAHLNQLRQSHDVRKLEHEKKLEATAKQYAAPVEAGVGGPLQIFSRISSKSFKIHPFNPVILVYL